MWVNTEEPLPASIQIMHSLTQTTPKLWAFEGINLMTKYDTSVMTTHLRKSAIKALFPFFLFIFVAVIVERVICIMHSFVVIQILVHILWISGVYLPWTYMYILRYCRLCTQNIIYIVLYVCDIYCMHCRQCAGDALHDMSEWLDKEGGEVAVSMLSILCAFL